MDRASLEQAYQRLQSIRQQKAQDPSKSQGQQYENTASVAKVIDSRGLDGTALGKTENLKPAFDRANDGKVEQAVVERAGTGSETVKKDAPRHDMRPPSPQRTGPDQQAAGQKIATEQKQAKARMEEIKARHEQAKSEKMKDDRERD